MRRLVGALRAWLARPSWRTRALLAESGWRATARELAVVTADRDHHRQRAEVLHAFAEQTQAQILSTSQQFAQALVERNQALQRWADAEAQLLKLAATLDPDGVSAPPTPQEEAEADYLEGEGLGDLRWSRSRGAS